MNGTPVVPFVVMGTQRDKKRLGLFLPLRLASYVILMTVVVFWMKYPTYLHFQVIVYSVLTLIFAISLSLEKRFRLRRLTYVLIALQSLMEISIESSVIYATGSINSPFSALFVLTIVSAALVYRMVGTLVVASLVSVAYAFIIWLSISVPGSPEFSLRALETVFTSQEPVFYAIFLHILIFYLTAFMSGYLAERLSSQDRQLVDTSIALKKAKLETDDILRHVNSGLLTIDNRGYIIYFNRAAESILGYREEKVKGMHCRVIFAERMPDLAEYLMLAVTSGVACPRKELEVANEKRLTIPLGLSVSILTEEGGGIRGVIGIFSDLTEAKQLERKVRVNDRLAAVGELSASIAHEIRNPLAAISGSVEVLQTELSLSGENARLMELMVKESSRLNVILSDFLSYARINRPTYTKVELCHIIGEVLELLRLNEAVPENISLELESDDSIVYVIGDENLIKQLLMNLAMNACEAFDGKAGRIVFGVAANPHHQSVSLRIQDNGPGIQPEHLERLFQPFFSTKTKGTGLGLAIVHRIAEALKLKLQVESRPGSGATFTIQFQSYSQDQPRQVIDSQVFAG